MTATPTPDYAGQRVVVLGATGFIGRWVARALVARRARLTLVVRDRAAALRLFAEYTIDGEVVVQDLRELAAVSELIRGLDPAVVFNLAGYGVDPAERDEETSHQMNQQLVAALTGAVAARRSEWPGASLVHTGSGFEYGPVTGPITEDVAENPSTVYARTKLAGTRTLVRRAAETGTRAVVARLFTVFGPGEGDGRLFPSLFQAARARTAVKLTAGLNRRDFTYVEDVAEGLVRLGLATPAPGTIVNLATGRLTSIREFAETVAETLGMPRELLAFGALPTRATEDDVGEVRLARLEQLLAWVPRTGIAVGTRRAAAFEWQRPTPSAGCA